jgi:hypothetical protein
MLRERYARPHAFQGETHPEQFDYVPDPADRKFAALARRYGV